ncbi:hypothetical protein SAMN05444166_1056 [Singulisphaera sp. GP187]|uniref:hypothetical protein n=1 Tax=Singulisphaera sp. GP187 TaxID=1882752 RepID=UPI00092A158F|nr:hypothetical protein [Singulisphaera sp. GP187]SIN81607.1 hypothetical protein SAMN05444166_1056 [Singulisphaera sp. GP187]
MSKPNSLFRGSELPRLLLLLVILIGGMVLLWKYIYFKRVPLEANPVARVPLTPIVPDKSPEFDTVRDKTEIQLRDMAAYKKLLTQVETLSPAALSKISRRDVLSIQIWEHPEHYRGVPIQIVGTVLRVMTYESKLSRTGRLYEAWMVTSDSQRNFYVCVFEDPPKGFPVGDNLSERIVFNGYFFKLMKYQSGKDLGFYVSPVLVGRIGWSEPVAVGGAGGGAPSPAIWMAVAVGLMFIVSFYRWMTGLRRSLSPLSRAAFHREHPSEEIAPEELTAWLENVADDDQAGEPEKLV